MKKRLIISVLVFSIYCMAGAGHADELKDRFSLGVVGGGVFPKDSDIDDSWYLGGNFAYGLNDYIALGAEVGYSSWDDKEGGVDYGDIRAVPILADIYVRTPLEVGGKKLVPYAIGGIGVILWDYEESSLLTSNGISVSMDPELGVKLGGGADYFLTNNLAINFEGSYIWSDADVSVTAFGANAAATIDTDAWILNGGIKYYF